MFGPYMMVSPVFNYDNTTSIYTPKKYNWIDFWTGDMVQGGQYLNDVVVPLSQIPLHVHQGIVICCLFTCF